MTTLTRDEVLMPAAMSSAPAQSAPCPVSGATDAGPGARSPWAIVLAGGEGWRLRPLTRYVCGDDRPKQFAPLLGGCSLLRHTLTRIGLGIPLARTIVVGHVRDAAYLAEELRREEHPECLLQPEDRGTAAAILWAAHLIARREPDAVAVVFPSDHYVEGEPAFMGHVLEVAAFVRRQPGHLVLLGAVPDAAETGYGWIAPGAPVGRLTSGTVQRVRRFWEKPALDVARACLAAGALWNTFVLAGQAANLVAVGDAMLPDLGARLARLAALVGTPEEPGAIRQAFAGARPASFSRHVLERAPAGLAVSRMPPAVTWADWGTPERVIGTLRRTGLRPRWLETLGDLPLRSA